MQLKGFKKLTHSLGIINDAIREFPPLLDTLGPAVGEIIEILANEKCDMIEKDPSLKGKLDDIFKEYVDKELR
ncbi:hypothetical protein [Pedobacter sp.]|uniref:hypothetical protein n=1 Tax=Pedobacter sp. TaxID=1411316 RepID=UPI003D7F4206